MSARWVLPVGGPPVADGAVLVGADGRIAAVGPEAAVPRPAGAAALALGDAALLPGLVDAHCHLELTALRGLVRDLPFPAWLQTVRALKRALDPEALRASTRWGVLEGFAAGITTFGDTGSGQQVAPALAALGGRGVAYHEVYGPDPAQCAEVVAGLERALDELAPCASDRVTVGLAPHAPYTVSEPLLAAVTAVAATRGLKTAMHVAESREERELVEEARGPFADDLRARGIRVDARGMTIVRWLERVGFLARRPLLIHCVTAGADDFRIARRLGATAVHCPWSNAVLGHGRADLRAMRGAGLAVGLGTDSVAAGGRLDLFAEARLAATGVALAPREMLRLMTADGAAALGLADAGTLTPGAWGDLAAVDLSGPAFAAARDVEEAVAWGATASDVTLAAVAGRVVYDRGRFPGVALAAERDGYARAAAAVSRAPAPGGMLARS
ncbi:MAG TPA: amidohydrolase family protein [Gemmatimonadales bacterium]|nr:amidohydrolase family protein [Gemmatimonadales bacterium]